MVWQIIHGGNIDYRRLDVRIPWLDGMLHPLPHNPYYASSPLKIERLFESFPAPRVFKTHLPYDLVPKPRDEVTKPRYIYVMRNPKDTAVSFYHHFEIMPKAPHRSWDEYFELFIKGEGILSLLWKALPLSLSLSLFFYARDAIKRSCERGSKGGRCSEMFCIRSPAIAYDDFARYTNGSLNRTMLL